MNQIYHLLIKEMQTFLKWKAFSFIFKIAIVNVHNLSTNINVRVNLRILWHSLKCNYKHSHSFLKCKCKLFIFAGNKCNRNHSHSF